MSPAPLQFALEPPSGPRVARFLGRVVALVAGWRLASGLLGDAPVSAGGLVWGGLGLLGGLALWLAGDHRIRHPRRLLEVDRAAGIARVREDGVVVAQSPLRALGPWTRRTFVGDETNGRRATTWHASRAAGFGARDLGVALTEGWLIHLEMLVTAASLPFDSTGWRFSEAEVARVMRRYRLPDRDALLWAAAAFDAGQRHLDGRTLQLGARTLAQMTVGEQLGGALLGGLARLFQGAGPLVLGTVGAAWGLRQVMQTTRLEWAVILGVLLAILAVAWRGAGRPLVAAAVAVAGGGVLLSRPWLDPITTTFDGETHVFGPLSETHLYFVVPGAGLLLVAAILISTLKGRPR